MERIKIEDLPPVESLTPEELEEVFGAGLRLYKPMFEALEAHEMESVSVLLAVTKF
jgi:hypothetical protein